MSNEAPPLNLMDSITAAIARRKEKLSFRSLSQNSGLIDFSSNDYLGFARNQALRSRVAEIENSLRETEARWLGAAGSRLLSGNSAFYEKLEASIAQFHAADAALLYSSGYDANVGVFSCLVPRQGTVVYDELVHASIRDGVRLGLARSFSFRHNDLNDLEHKLKNAEGPRVIAVESVYSMDGDLAPLAQMAQLAETYDASLVVDEAHATGVFGPEGQGLVFELGLLQKVFARVITFGKAMGCHGAAVVGPQALRDYLINFSRAFIYTTAMPPASVAAISAAYDYVPHANSERASLQSLIKSFAVEVAQLNERRALSLISCPAAIQVLLAPGNQAAKNAAALLRESGFDVRAILSPTVPAGLERLRLCLHAYNTSDEVRRLFALLDQVLAVRKASA